MVPIGHPNEIIECTPVTGLCPQRQSSDPIHDNRV